MTEGTARLTRHDVEAKIVKRCWANEEFRKEFTTDPAGAFVRYLKVPAATLPKIVIHEERVGSWHIVLPLRPSNVGELSDGDLERVAAGARSAFGTAEYVSGVTVALIGSAATTAVASLAASEVHEVLGW